MRVRVGTRASILAMAQTRTVVETLSRLYTGVDFEIVAMSTKGDVVRDRPIGEIGGDAPFARELEDALLRGDVDMAVHSMKDLSAKCPAGLVLAKAWKRGDARDALVAADPGVRSIADLPPGAVVATGSVRRNLFLRRLRPDLEMVQIRGNVDTRLGKLFSPGPGQRRLDAIVLAAAGLERIGKAGVISSLFDVDDMIPAANQGQIAIEMRSDDASLLAIAEGPSDAPSEEAALAERMFMLELGVDCRTPVAAFAERTGGRLSLRCMFARDVSSRPAVCRVFGERPADVAREAARQIRSLVSANVVIAGAGPGDPSLATLAAIEAVESAECIVCDRLVPREILSRAPASCRVIDAGKSAGSHTLEQGEINAVLAREALLVRNVVRLKGGDPFVFGRGAEEVEYLRSLGIACRVIPGVSSSIAAPAAAGIPLTVRGVRGGFHVVSAHSAGKDDPGLDFRALATCGGTLVFMMGLSRISAIAEGLMAAGMPPGARAAVVCSGTTSRQASVERPLCEIAAASAGMEPPGVLVVGGTLDAISAAGPLHGRRIAFPVVFGASGAKIASSLRDLGADVFAPVVGVIAPDPEGLEKLSKAGKADFVVLTSASVLKVAKEEVAMLSSGGAKILAIGKSTARSAAEAGLEVAFASREAGGDGFAKEVAGLVPRSARVVHPMACDAADPLSAIASRCDYEAVGVYRNAETGFCGEVDLSRFDAAVFASPSAASRFAAAASGETDVVAIGATTARRARELGFARIHVARSPDGDGVVSALGDVFRAQTNFHLD